MTREADHPVARFETWWAEAREADLSEPAAVALATADEDGRPSARMVLLRGVGPDGFVFYTNLASPKSRDLRGNPRAALLFYWMPLGRQVRVKGRVEPVDEAEADRYFASRSRQSQLAAWASRQSETLDSPEALERHLSERRREFHGREVPRPPFWSGFRVVPEEIEFWMEGPHRLHRRERFRRDGEGWRMELLYP